MMEIKDIVDDIVLLVLDNHEPLQKLGIDGNKMYTSVVGYDEYGVWVKHPQFPIPILKDPPEKGGKQQFKPVTASMLIPWGFIVSIVHFPGVEGFDFESPFDKHVGFEIKKP